ncbi:SulP family inorganic anion transporter [Tessaracoccus coleopterorum]|uniref:SulP family inorganic anion transporter n=1 Tax=Tessaracoccus coleopterorum TaxID=2714950 RepID=UPI0018D4C89A|nr:SulP family inorganic anion transporter [Tessaracoccus coleopterorum]
MNIGYAQIAGLPVTAGLAALIVPTIVYALLVSSRQVVASRTRPPRRWCSRR